MRESLSVPVLDRESVRRAVERMPDAPCTGGRDGRLERAEGRLVGRRHVSEREADQRRRLSFDLPRPEPVEEHAAVRGRDDEPFAVDHLAGEASTEIEVLSR